jgi:hypothetical protein
MAVLSFEARMKKGKNSLAAGVKDRTQLAQSVKVLAIKCD